MEPSFSEYWAIIQHEVPIEEALPAWSVASQAKTKFEITNVMPSLVIVRPENGRERKVPKSDFQSVFGIWDDYKSRRMPRHQLGFSQHSTYIISIFHWAEGVMARRHDGTFEV